MRNNRPAYTLLELLITSAIFLVVVMLATISLLSTTKLQLVHKRSQDVTLQAEQILRDISEDVRLSAASLQTIHLGSTHDWMGAQTTAPDDDLLVLRAGRALENGQRDNSVLETHIYCAELQLPDGTSASFTGKRIVRYVLTGTPVLQAVTQVACTPAFIKEMFSLGSNPEPEYLSQPQLETLGFRAWPFWLKDAEPAQQYDLDANAVRLELSVRYNEANTGQAESQRASEAGESNTAVSPQIVLRQVASRNSF